MAPYSSRVRPQNSLARSSWRLADLALFRPAIQPENTLTEAALLLLVLDGMTSKHSKRAYAKALTDFFAWIRASYKESEHRGSRKAWSRSTGRRCLSVGFRPRPSISVSRLFASLLANSPTMAASIPQLRQPSSERRVSSVAGSGQGTGFSKTRSMSCCRPLPRPPGKANAIAPSWHCSLPAGSAAAK